MSSFNVFHQANYAVTAARAGASGFQLKKMINTRNDNQLISKHLTDLPWRDGRYSDF